MLRDIQAIDEKYLIPQPKKGKKRITLRLGLKRPRKPENEITKYVKEMNKRNLRSLNEVKNYLSSVYSSVTKGMENLYHTIIASRVENGKIHLSDNLSNRPLSRYDLFVSQDAQTITNDVNVLHVISCNYYDKFKDGKDLITFWLSSAGLDSIHIASPGYLFENSIKKGYYQDFETNFAAVGLEELDEKDRNELLVPYEKMNDKINEYTIGGNTFYYFGDCKACVVCSKEIYDAQRIKECYEKMKILHTGKKIELNVKTFKLNNKVKFLDLKLTPESFCPAFIILPMKIKVNLLIKSDYNYNDLFNTIEQMFMQDNRLILPDNLFYWSQVSECMDFLAVLGLTSTVLSNDAKQQLTNLYDDYLRCKFTVNVMARNQMELQKILVRFYNSFQTQINYEILDDLSKKLENYITLKTRISAPEFWTGDFRTFLKKLGDLNIAQMVLNQESDAVESCIASVRNCIDLLINKTAVARTYIEKIRDTCKVIYVLFNTGENPGKVAFNQTLAPGAFFGNLGQKIEEDMLEVNIRAMKQKVNIANEKKSEEINRIQEILDNRDDYLKKLIENSANEYLKERKLKLLREQKQVMMAKAFEASTQNENNKTIINNLITKLVLNDADFSKVTSTTFNTIFKEYCDDIELQLNQNRISNEIQKNKNEYQINNLKQKNKQINQGLGGENMKIDEEEEEIIGRSDVQSQSTGTERMPKSRINVGLGLPEKETVFGGIIKKDVQYMNTLFNVAAGKQKSASRNDIDITHHAGNNNPGVMWLKNVIFTSGAYDLKSANDVYGDNYAQILQSYRIPAIVLLEGTRRGVIQPLTDVLDGRQVIYASKPIFNKETAEYEFKKAINNGLAIPDGNAYNYLREVADTFQKYVPDKK